LVRFLETSFAISQGCSADYCRQSRRLREVKAISFIRIVGEVVERYRL
jgi:hypothetical protein